MPFRKLESQKKSEYVVSQILEAIKAGEYRVGDRLPSEMDIAEMTGVSRPSVWEALGALRLVGVIETKNGYGTYVKTENWVSDSVKIESQIPSILNQGGNTFEALEARKTVEPAVAELALEMMNKDDSMRIFKAF